MKITYQDSRKSGMIDSISIITKPVFSFVYEWFLVTDTKAEFTPKDRENYPELVDITEADMIAMYANRPMTAEQKAEVIAFYNAYIRPAQTIPIYDSATQKLVESTVTEVIAGLTYATYDVGTLTQLELDAKFKATVPTSITNAQARLALINTGLYTTINIAITTGTDDILKVQWEYETILKRDNLNLIAMATSLGLTELQLDELFILAATL